MITGLRPSGTYARWQGRDYEAVVLRDGVVNLQVHAAAAPPGFSVSSRGPGWYARRIPSGELEALEAITTFARWRGHECVVLALLDDDHVLLSDDGKDQAWVRSNAHSREPGVWDVIAPASELEATREESRNLRSP